MAKRGSYLDTAKRVIATEARALDQRPDHRDRRWKVRPHRPQDRGNFGINRHARALCSSSRGKPWRPWRRAQGRHRVGDFQFRRSRFDIPLIGLSSNASSALMTQADIQLLIPQLGEACGHNVVPTNSTTMTLALGDALAVALMEARAFTPANFREFHPGGKLGARLSKVRDLMHTGNAVPLIQSSATIPETLAEISKKGFGVVGVAADDGTLEGIITDGDLRRHLDGLMGLSPSDVMTKQPQTIGPDILAEEAVAVMNDRKITCLFAVDDDGIAGILHIHDCLRAGLG